MKVKYFQLSTLSRAFYLQVIDAPGQRLFIEYNTQGEKIESFVLLDYYEDVIKDIEYLYEEVDMFELESCLWPYIINKK